MDRTRKGLMLVLSSPSGAGKSSLCRKIVYQDKNTKMSISATTRPKRKSEKNGVDYFFLEKKDFFEKKERGYFIETARVFNFDYGTPKKFIEENLLPLHIYLQTFLLHAHILLKLILLNLQKV